MKKSFLLFAIIPALAVLSGCGPKAAKNLMIEDTNAHNELFGDIENVDFGTKSLQPKAALGAGDYTPVLGFQQKNNLDGTYSVRFVAAIESVTTAARWYRTVQDSDGTVVTGKEKSYFDVTTVYSSLNEGGELRSYAIDEIETDDNLGSKPFSYYAVYCLLNIPNASYYVNAYCAITNPGGTKNSPVGSFKVSDKSDRLKFNLTGSNRDAIAVNGAVVESGDLDGGKNKSAIYDVSLNANDKLHCYWIDEENLKYVLNTSVSIGGYHQDDFSLEDSVLTTLHAGQYKVFLTSNTNGAGENKLFFQKMIYLQAPSFWGDAEAKAMLTQNDGSTSQDLEMTWVKNQSSGEKVYKAYVDISNNYRVGFFRRGSGDWNWSDFTNLPEDGKNFCTYVDSPKSFTWSVYAE